LGWRSVTTRLIVLGAPADGVYVVSSVTATRGARRALGRSRTLIVRVPESVSSALDPTVTVRLAIRRAPRRAFVAPVRLTLALTATRPRAGTLTVSTMTPPLVTRMDRIANAPLAGTLVFAASTPPGLL